MTKVLIADEMSPDAEATFEARGIEVEVSTDMDEAELTRRIGAYDGLVVRSATKVTAAVIEGASSLKVIGRAGMGVDNIDVNAATARGIVVMNTPYGNSITTAEHAIAMMFALARQIPQANQSTHAGKWERSRFVGVELMGKTLGIVGCGNVGSVVADRAQGLRMKVIAYDPYLSPGRASDLGVEKVDFDTLLGRADFVSLHAPLTDATRSLVDAQAIAKMKPGARIINCARGGLIVEADLKSALESGQVAAAALDVYSAEPPKGNVLLGMESVVATPHLGASTTEAQEKVALQVTEQISDFLLNGAVVNALNMPSVSAEDAPKLVPSMRLAEQLGSFAGQITETAIKAISIEYGGQAAQLNTSPLTAAVLKGLLTPLLETVNLVSAPVIARERNIEVTEVKREHADAFQTQIKLDVTTEAQSRSVAGTLFGAEMPRIVEIRGIP
ncbi:MAG: phosphoglycerate dehydrogenase, partial [Rhodospirillales bacterium]|nr:phosphoglycerate dehydrogenase [Rhodospirillales bacterium]